MARLESYIQPDIKKMDEEYIESGRWKCPESPTGAHYSVETSKEGSYGIFLCKYCLRIHKQPIVYDITLARLYGKGKFKEAQ